MGADHHLIAKTHSGHSAQAPEVQITISTYPSYAALTENKKRTLKQQNPRNSKYKRAPHLGLEPRTP